MICDHGLEKCLVGLCRLGGNSLNVNQLHIVAVNKDALHIQHIGESTRHAGTEIVARWTQHSDYTTGHIFAAVITSALNYGDGARVTHGKALAHLTSCIELATSGAVQTGITHNRCFIGLKLAAGRRTQYQLAPGHALAHIIIGITLEIDFQTTGVPNTQRLTSYPF